MRLPRPHCVRPHNDGVGGSLRVSRRRARQSHTLFCHNATRLPRPHSVRPRNDDVGGSLRAKSCIELYRTKSRAEWHGVSRRRAWQSHTLFYQNINRRPGLRLLIIERIVLEKSFPQLTKNKKRIIYSLYLFFENFFHFFFNLYFLFNYCKTFKEGGGSNEAENGFCCKENERGRNTGRHE